MNFLQQGTNIHESTINQSTVKELQAILDKKINELNECDKCGNYVKADELKISIEQLKKQLNDKKIHQMISNHKKDKKKLLKCNQDQLNELNNTWTNKLDNFNCQKAKLKKQMQQKHQDQIIKTKIQLQSQISNKLKESSQCLNFRKIQEQMRKQKKYAQAHQIQQRVIQMEKKEKIAFENQRQIKIKTALNSLKSKQKMETQALNKKLESNNKEMIKQRQKLQQKMNLKHSNAMRDMNSLQQKELLGEKGQIKSRVTLSMCRSRQKLMNISKN